MALSDFGFKPDMIDAMLSRQEKAHRRKAAQDFYNSVATYGFGQERIGADLSDGVVHTYYTYVDTDSNSARDLLQEETDEWLSGIKL